MITIPHRMVSALGISPLQAIEWVKESFLLKASGKVLLPHKTSIAFEPGKFMNTMPCVIPPLHVLGAKIVTRYPERTPSIDGDILLYDYRNGDLLALLDAFWITAARTGAVAALAVQTFAKTDMQSIGIMGLGNTARATLSCLAALYPQHPLHIKLLAYKDHAQRFIAEFKNCSPTINFHIVPTMQDLLHHTDVLISCVTNTDSQFASDSLFKPGITVIPVHTKGFQNCDLFFDKIFADDRAHVQGFKYFSRFRHFDELGNVLTGRAAGRSHNTERILSYNIGLGIHDIVFAKHIYDLLLKTKTAETDPSIFHF